MIHVSSRINSKIQTHGYYITFRNGQGWTPLVTQDIQANAAVGIDVWVVDAGGKIDFRGLERVVGREVDG